MNEGGDWGSLIADIWIYLILIIDIWTEIIEITDI